MTISVQGPDGAVNQFPDGTADNVIESAMRQQYGTPAPSSGGLADTIDSGYKAYNRASGLAGRTLVSAIPSAIGGLPALAADGVDATKNIGLMGYNAVAPYFGGDKVDVPAPFAHTRALRDLGESAANLMGLPEPETKLERGLVNIGGAGLTALGGAGLAGSLGKVAAASPRVASVMGDLAAGPGWQAAGAAAGAGAGQAAQDAGFGPAATFGFGMVGSMLPGGAATVGERALGGAGAAFAAPFRSVGEDGFLPGASREAIAGKVLNKLATSPGITPSIMDASGPIVPGSNPTVAQVSRDPGLIGAETGIRNSLDNGQATSGRYSQRLSEQNTARQGALDNIIMPSQPVPEGGTPQRGTLEYAQAKRDRAVTQNRAQAFRSAGIADHDPVLDTINRILSTPEGAKTDIQDAMAFAYNRLNQDRIDMTDPETLYAIRQDLADAKNGKYNSDRPNLARAGTQLGQVIGSLDDVINQAAPGYSRYMDLYRKRSIPLNQQEALQTLRERGQVSASDPISNQPTRILTLGKFGTAVRSALSSGQLGRGVGNANLSDPQIQTLVDVTQDLDRGAATTAATIKPPGSDTFKNLSIANVIGRVIGDHFPDTPLGNAAQTLAKPLSWMYSLPDAKIGQLLVEATLDPHLASRLMRQANQHEVQSIANELAQRAAQQAKGAGLYSNTNQAP